MVVIFNFRFGKRAALAFTDYRSARPDHLVPEDAFPGGLAYDEAALRALTVTPAALMTTVPKLVPFFLSV